MLMQNLAAAQGQRDKQCGFLLHLVVGERAVILKLLAAVDEALLVRGDAFLVPDLGTVVQSSPHFPADRNSSSVPKLGEFLYNSLQFVECCFSQVSLFGP